MYPVCGTGLGDTAGLASVPFIDISSTAPAPSPDTTAGAFILQITSNCEHGDDVQITPPSAARILKQAPTADGRYAGVRITSYATDYRIIGTGAIPFVLKVDVPCAALGSYCPSDPRYTGPPKP